MIKLTWFNWFEIHLMTLNYMGIHFMTLNYMGIHLMTLNYMEIHLVTLRPQGRILPIRILRDRDSPCLRPYSQMFGSQIFWSRHCVTLKYRHILLFTILKFLKNEWTDIICYLPPTCLAFHTYFPSTQEPKGHPPS